LIAFHDRGFATMLETKLAESPSRSLTLQPWGRVEGMLLIGRKPGAWERLMLLPKRAPGELPESVMFEYESRADAEGHFHFERVLPGENAVSRAVPQSENQWRFGPWVPFEVEPERTARVTVGGLGRAVVGRAVKAATLKVAIDWTRTDNQFRLRPPEVHEPENMTLEQRRIWYDAWVLTNEGIARQKYERYPRHYGFSFQADGSFRIDDVAAGTYTLVIDALDVSNRRPIATARRTVIVPEMPGGRSDQPLDLGTLEMLLVP
jgi:hypothetical protein